MRGRINDPPTPGRSALAGKIDTIEIMKSEGIDLEVLHFLSNRLIDNRMGDRRPRCVFLENGLRLLVEFDAFAMVDFNFGPFDECIVLGIAPLRYIGATDAVTTQKPTENIVWIAIVAGRSLE